MKISLNLATRPFADLGPQIKRLRIGMGVLAGLSLLLWVSLHYIHQSAEAARARNHSLDGQLAQVTRERQGYTAMMQQPDNAKLLQQAAVLNKLIDQKSFSWTLAMEDLETVLPGGVQVTSLEPVRDEKTGKITLHMRVQGPRDRNVDLVRNLEHSRRFLKPRIAGENSVAEENERPGTHLAPATLSDRVDFDLLADYNPATPEERKQNKLEAKKQKAEDGMSTPGPVHRLPLPQPGQGRPAYPASARPMNPPINQPRPFQGAVIPDGRPIPPDRPLRNRVPLPQPIQKSNPGVPQ